MKKIAIIGGGAAGMMCAARILEATPVPLTLHLFEKNTSLGAKVLISGGGRCNVTTGLKNKHQLLKKYPRGSDFLTPSLSTFTPQKVYRWFESHGVPLKIEKDNRVFPVSNNGKDIVGVFENLFNNRVTLRFEEKVTDITRTTSGYRITTPKDSGNYDMIVITTGGNAYRATGSTGDGYAFAQALGHTITPLGPSLNSFLTADTWTHNLSGLSFPQARLTYKQHKETGPLLFTHFGISGPVTFALSAHLAYETITPHQPLTIQVQLDTQSDFQKCDVTLRELFELHPKKQINTLLASLGFPQRFVESLLTHLTLDLTLKGGEVSKTTRHAICHNLTQLPLTLTQRRPGDEFVTAGGVTLDEVDPHTLESKISPGLFFAGEILDIDGVTGGFNLQSSWATGYCAGTAIANMITP